MRKKVQITINGSKSEFTFGNCAIIAICTAFNMPIWNVYNIFTRVGVGIFEGMRGLTFVQCKRIISYLDKNSRYTANKAQINYCQLMILFPNDKFIVMFSEHLSYCENGEIWDSFISKNKRKERDGWIYARPTGWWKIN